MTSLQSVAQELKWAARRLVRSRGFAVTSIGFLGIAIGVATTVFSFINSALIRPLPYAEADRLVAVTEDDGQSSLRRILVSTSTLAALRREARSFDAIAAYRDNVVVVATGDQVQTLVVTEVDSAALGTLGVRPQLGSAPTNADYASGARVALVSDRYWRSRLGGSNDVIGIELRIRDTAYHITGVMPPGFGFSGNSDVWLPLASTSPDANSNSSELYSVLARLKPGVARDRASAELAAISSRLRQDDPKYFRSKQVVMREDAVFRVTRAWAPILFLFAAGVASVLLVACVNVATLLSLRATEQRGALAVRRALGATTARLLSHSVLECLLIVATASTIGLVIATGLVPLLTTLAALGNMPSWFQVGLDHRVFLFSAALAGFVVVMVGLRPARMSFRLDIRQILKDSGDGGATSADVSRAGARGVAVQVALSTILATASVLLGVTYYRVTGVDAGYARDQVVTVNPRIDPKTFPDARNRWLGMQRLSTAVSTVSEVEAATVGADFAGYRARGADSALRDVDVFRASDAEPVNGRAWLHARRLVVEPNYFKTMQIRLLRGRSFLDSDTVGATRVVVVSARAAELLWPRGPAIGQTLRLGSNASPLRVVGVVGDIIRSGYGPEGVWVDPIPTFYLPSGQAIGTNIVVHARINGDPEKVEPAIGREVVRTLGPVPFFIRTPAMDQHELIRLLRTSGIVFGACAVIACLLAALGVYAVIGFRVVQQTREIGIRLALGASPFHVQWSAARDCWLSGAAGLMVGLLISAGVAYLLRSAIWGVSPFALVVYGSVGLIMTTMVLLGGVAASRYARRVTPASAMRAS